MNTCILITSHLNSFKKEEITIQNLKFFQDKGFPIIFVGNYPISPLIQSLSDYTFNIKENPKCNRVLFFDNRSLPDYGYAHLHQMGKAFNLCQMLGYDYVHHFNYDVAIDEENFNILVDKGSKGDFLCYQWGHNGIHSSRFSIQPSLFLKVVSPLLHYYKNDNPPSTIDDGWICESFFKWTFTHNNIKVTPQEKTAIKFKHLSTEW